MVDQQRHASTHSKGWWIQSEIVCFPTKGSEHCLVAWVACTHTTVNCRCIVLKARMWSLWSSSVWSGLLLALLCLCITVPSFRSLTLASFNTCWRLTCTAPVHLILHGYTDRSRSYNHQQLELGPALDPAANGPLPSTSITHPTLLSPPPSLCCFAACTFISILVVAGTGTRQIENSEARMHADLY